jgi:DNA-binding FadR family transcriptional regulator
MQSCAEARDEVELLKADREFHLALVNCAHNSLATKFVEHLFDALQKGWWPQIKRRIYEYRAPIKSVALHQAILAALIAGDAPALVVALQEHFRIIHRELHALSVRDSTKPDLRGRGKRRGRT